MSGGRGLLTMALALLPASAVADGASTFAALGAMALQRNLDLASAQSELEAQSEEVEVLEGSFLPRVDLFAVKRESVTGMLGLEINQQLFNAESDRALEAAESLLASQEEDILARKQSLLLEVVNARLELHRFVDAVESLRQRQEVMVRRLYEVRRLVEEGLASYFEESQTEAELATIEADLLGAEDDRQSAVQSLELISRARLAALPSLRGDPTFQPPAPLPELQARMEQNNPMLAAALSRERALQGQLEETLAAGKPIVELELQHSNTSTDLSLRLLSQLYSGGEASARVRQARHRLEAGRLATADLRQNLTQLLRVAHRSARSALSEHEALASEAYAHQLTVEKIHSAWRQGFSSTDELRRAEERKFAAELSLRLAYYDYLLTVAQIEGLLGDLNYEYLTKLDSHFTEEIE